MEPDDVALHPLRIRAPELSAGNVVLFDVSTITCGRRFAYHSDPTTPLSLGINMSACIMLAVGLQFFVERYYYCRCWAEWHSLQDFSQHLMRATLWYPSLLSVVTMVLCYFVAYSTVECYDAVGTSAYWTTNMHEEAGLLNMWHY